MLLKEHCEFSAREENGSSRGLLEARVSRECLSAEALYSAKVTGQASIGTWSGQSQGKRNRDIEGKMPRFGLDVRRT